MPAEESLQYFFNLSCGLSCEPGIYFVFDRVKFDAVEGDADNKENSTWA